MADTLHARISRRPAVSFAQEPVRSPEINVRRKLETRMLRYLSWRGLGPVWTGASRDCRHSEKGEGKRVDRQSWDHPNGNSQDEVRFKMHSRRGLADKDICRIRAMQNTAYSDTCQQHPSEVGDCMSNSFGAWIWGCRTAST